VVFQSKLGSVGAKVKRVEALALHIARYVEADEHSTQRAAALCKADLTTHMVGEFPDLQGVMGMHYALKQGERRQVADAIAEHYLPRGAGDRLPSSDIGAAIAIADRIDTIVGCFAVGLQPTGSADAYGVRRAALGVLAILIDREWDFDLENELVSRAAKQLEHVATANVTEVMEFFKTRLRGLLIERGLPQDCVDAALGAGFYDVPSTVLRADAVAQLRSRPDFEPLATAFKRVANILKGETIEGEPDPSYFRDESERTLWNAFLRVRSDVDKQLDDADYPAAMRRLADLKEPVDRFFDTVLVMDTDQTVRNNRLALLGRINTTFRRIADFRQLAV